MTPASPVSPSLARLRAYRGLLRRKMKTSDRPEQEPSQQGRSSDQNRGRGVETPPEQQNAGPTEPQDHGADSISPRFEGEGEESGERREEDYYYGTLLQKHFLPPQNCFSTTFSYN